MGAKGFLYVSFFGFVGFLRGPFQMLARAYVQKRTIKRDIVGSASTSSVQECCKLVTESIRPVDYIPKQSGDQKDLKMSNAKSINGLELQSFHTLGTMYPQ